MDLIPPPSDDYPEVLAAVIAAVLDKGKDAGAEILEPIAFAPREITRRPNLSVAVQGQVFRRDHFTCRYCGGRLIPTPVMRVIGALYPAAFPYTTHWKGGSTHPAILSRSPIIDHVVPGSIGGDWREVDNLVTACWPCNGRKADFTLEQLAWRLLPIDPDSRWDGLTSRYEDLWRAAQEPEPGYHRPWLKALGGS